MQQRKRPTLYRWWQSLLSNRSLMKEMLNQKEDASRLAVTLFSTTRRSRCPYLYNPGLVLRKNGVSHANQHEVFLRTRLNSTLEGLRAASSSTNLWVLRFINNKYHQPTLCRPLSRPASARLQAHAHPLASRCWRRPIYSIHSEIRSFRPSAPLEYTVHGFFFCYLPYTKRKHTWARPPPESKNKLVGIGLGIISEMSTRIKREGIWVYFFVVCDCPRGM